MRPIKPNFAERFPSQYRRIKPNGRGDTYLDQFDSWRAQDELAAAWLKVQQLSKRKSWPSLATDLTGAR
jgi:hypothetical protein